MGLLRQSLQKGNTLPKILKYNAKAFGEDPAIMEKKTGVWRLISWRDYYDKVEKIALGLFSLGFKEKDVVIIVGENSAEWYFIELAVYSLRGITLGVSPESQSSRVLSLANRFNVRFVFAEDQEQVDKVFEVKGDIPSLERVVYWKYRGLGNYKDRALLGMRELIRIGEETKKSTPSLIDDIVEKTYPDDPCTVVFTSGSEGEPKGVFHSHRAIIENVERYLEVDPWKKTDRFIPFLAPFGLVEKWFSVGCHLLTATSLYIAESPQTYRRDMREANPTVVFFPGYAWEKIITDVRQRMKHSDRVKRFVYSFFMEKSITEKTSYYAKFLNYLGEFLLYKPLKKHLGLADARLCYNIGPLLSKEVFSFYHSLGVPLKNLYWMSEAGFVSVSQEMDQEPENVGAPFKGIEVTLSEKGEIVLVGGHIFKGYVQNGKEARTDLRNGAFSTGDVGTIDPDRRICLFGHTEDLLRLSRSSTVSAQILESVFRLNTNVKDAWVFREKNGDTLCAILIMDEERLRRLAVQKGISYIDPSELVQKQEVLELVRGEVREMNRAMPHGQKIMRYVVLPETFCVEDETVSYNRRLRKGYIRAAYKDLVEGLSNGKEKVRIAFPQKKVMDEKEFQVNFLEEVDK